MHTADQVALNAQEKLRAIANTLPQRRGVRSLWYELSLLTGLTEGQVKRIYYAEWRVLPAHVFMIIGDAYRVHLEKAAARYERQAALTKLALQQWDDDQGCSAELRRDGS